MYTYMPISKIKSPKNIKHNRLTWQTKETKNYIYQNKSNYSTNWKNKTKVRCQLENKAMKVKLTNMLRGKERKNRYAKLNRGR